MNTPIRVLIVDDHEIVREGLATLLSEEPTIEVVGQASNGVEALTLSKLLQPDVILMDVVMPEMDGIETTRHIRQAHLAAQVIILTTYTNDEHVRAALEAGAIGYLVKDVLKADLLRAIHTAKAGKPTLHPDAQHYLMQQVLTPAPLSRLNDLTKREEEVLRLIAQGYSNKEISMTLHLTEGTVKGYVSAILAKLEVADRTQAALYAVKHRLIDLPLD
jgi:DNA-binding NarL/FixJ family response regulator